RDFGVRPVRAHETGVKLAGQAPVRGVLAGAGDQAEVFYSAVRVRGVRVQGAELQPVLFSLSGRRGSRGLYTGGLPGLAVASGLTPHHVHMMDFTPTTAAAHNSAIKNE